MNLHSPEAKRAVAELVREAVEKGWGDVPLEQLEHMIDKGLQKTARAAREAR